MKKEYIYAYIAGIFDGEGCISSFKRQKKTKSPSVGIHCMVVMRKDFGGNTIVKEFYNIWGGYYQERPEKGNRKSTSRWQVTDKKAIKFLKDITPFLKIKKPQANLCLKFYKERIPPQGKGIGNGKGRKPLTSEAIQQRFDFFYKIKELNHGKY